ncbi:hypothetical protein AAWM_07203 [Aspergillus awamori]|uniref:Uncharacterized protein n=1 Tax=Aspergillus awamori TaxID=105351 RepID=A0A401KYC6_ASPAW|nr:hypothetical protein AAWM_07203 [Aspergillus awamori]
MLIPSPSVVYLPQLAHLTRPTGQLHATPPIQSGYLHAACPNPRHPRPSWRSPGRLAASPSARVPPPIPARLSRGASHHPISPGQLVNSLRQHARTQLSAGTGRLPAWPPAVSAGRDSWGTPTGPPRPGDRLARPTGQWPFVAHEGPDGLLALIPLESSQRDAESIPSSVGFLRRSRMANWRMKLVEREGGRDPWLTAGSPIPEAPSNRPALPDLSQQGYLTAYTTRLVTSVVCRGFIPARGDIAIRQPAPRGFSLGAVASLLRCMARRPIRIQLRRAGQHRRVPARILT